MPLILAPSKIQLIAALKVVLSLSKFILFFYNLFFQYTQESYLLRKPIKPISSTMFILTLLSTLYNYRSKISLYNLPLKVRLVSGIHASHAVAGFLGVPHCSWFPRPIPHLVGPSLIQGFAITC